MGVMNDLSIPTQPVERPRRVLTAKGASWEVTQELQHMLCLTDDGVLYVSQQHVMDVHVRAFMERLRRRGHQFTPRPTPVADIRKLYESAVSVSQEEESTHRQTEVVQLIKQAVQLGASDVHFIVGRHSGDIKVRVDGELSLLSSLSAQHGRDLCATIYNSMCDVAEEFFQPERKQDARLKADFVHQCKLFGARVATTPTDSGVFMVLRLLYDSGLKTLTLEELGYLPKQVSLIRRMGQRTTGLNIFAGPTGSGKSTTLQSVLTQLVQDTEGRINLLTIEDPPEYAIRGAVQTPLLGDKDDDAEVSRSWARSISNAMRLDPDVIMVGEMRDKSSAGAAFRAAMTGHGVWTTLHANDVFSILARLQDIGVELSLLTDPALVTGLINQSLVRKLCPHCKKSYAEHKDELPADLIERIEHTCKVENIFLRGDGCPECKHKGIRGRTVVAEVVMPTKPLMDVFKASGKAEAREFWVKSEAGITKNRHLITLIEKGLVDPRFGEADVCPLDEDLITLKDIA